MIIHKTCKSISSIRNGCTLILWLLLFNTISSFSQTTPPDNFLPPLFLLGQTKSIILSNHKTDWVIWNNNDQRLQLCYCSHGINCDPKAVYVYKGRWIVTRDYYFDSDGLCDRIEFSCEKELTTLLAPLQSLGWEYRGFMLNNPNGRETYNILFVNDKNSIFLWSLTPPGNKDDSFIMSHGIIVSRASKFYLNSYQYFKK